MTPLTLKKSWLLISDTFLPYVEAKIEYDCFILIFPLGSEKGTQKIEPHWNKMEGVTAKKQQTISTNYLFFMERNRK